MNVEKIKLSELNLDPDNTRVHDKHNLDVIKQSLLKYGQYRPFIIQKTGMIIRIGNGMYQAMVELGWKEGDCLIKDINDEEATTLSILDNKASDLSYFDDTKLTEALKSLSQEDVSMTGFVDVELNKLFNSFDNVEDMSSIAEIKKDGEQKEKVTPTMQYQIVFTNQEDYKVWNSFVDMLRDKYNKPISECLVDFINEV